MLNLKWGRKANIITGIYLLLFSVLFLVNWILLRILKSEEIPILRETISFMFIILSFSLIIWFLIKRGKSSWRLLKHYFKGLNISAEISIALLLALVFLIISEKDIGFFLYISEICFVIAGFSFTAGSFFRKGEQNKKDFFNLSALFAIYGFLNVIYFLFFNVITLFEEPIMITILDILPQINLIEIVSSILVIFLFVLGILFWFVFRQLILLLVNISKPKSERVK
jgi:hypothetical protein